MEKMTLKKKLKLLRSTMEKEGAQLHVLYKNLSSYFQ